MQVGAISLLFQVEVGEEKPKIRLSLAQFQLNLQVAAISLIFQVGVGGEGENQNKAKLSLIQLN